MTELAWIAAVAVGALILAQGARVVAGRRGPEIQATAIVDHPAIIVFTADHCRRCDEVLAMTKHHPIPLVQIRAEVDAEVFAAHGVEAVPMTVVAGAGGRRVAQYRGVPRPRRLASAVDRARNTASR